MSRAPAVLYGLGTSVPRHTAPQERVLAFMSRLSDAVRPPDERSAGRKFLERIYAGSGIERRHSVLADYLADDPSQHDFFPRNAELDPFPSTQARLNVYERESVALSAEAARKAMADAGVEPRDITDVIVATCTGLFAPGPDILLVRELGLSPDARRSVIGFMGCYAGFTALRAAAQATAAEPEAVCLVVCVELCSLHFQKKPVADFLVGNSLFADGAGAAVIAGDGRFPRPLAAFTAFRSRLAADSLEQMSWRVGPTGFEMRLSREVPASLGGALPPFVDELLAAGGLTRADSPAWALHPGGRRIVEAAAGALNLDEAGLAPAVEVLARYGNMSSATILFVLENALRAARPGPVAALGFGPGLTMEGALLEKR